MMMLLENQWKARSLTTLRKTVLSTYFSFFAFLVSCIWLVCFADSSLSSFVMIEGKSEFVVLLVFLPLLCRV